MFERDNVPVRISNIAHRQLDKEETEHHLVEMTCEVSPLTPELAGELHDFVRATLYTRTGAEVNSLLGSASFALDIVPQAIAVRMAADQKKASFTITHAKIGSIRAKRSKKHTAWTLEFNVTCEPASEHQLAQMVESYLKVRCLSFAPAEPGLFDEEEKLAKTRGRRVSPGEEEADAEGATATH